MTIAEAATMLRQRPCRVAIVGISGSGKSTFARQLAALTSLPLTHMDSLFWLPDWTPVADTVWQQQEAVLSAQDNWIIEGYIDQASAIRLSRATLVIHLDPSGLACAINGLIRWWQHRGRSRPELPGCPEALNPGYLWTMAMRRERPDIMATIASTQPHHCLTLAHRWQSSALLAALDSA